LLIEVASQGLQDVHPEAFNELAYCMETGTDNMVTLIDAFLQFFCYEHANRHCDRMTSRYLLIILSFMSIIQPVLINYGIFR
jgi:hypothetical protein